MQKNIVPIIFIILSTLLFIVLAYSCNTSITGPSDEIAENGFPNQIGDEWKYFYYDSLSQSSDTVVVSIIGDTTFSGSRTAKIWQYKFRNNTEYRFVEILGDTVRIYDYLQSLWINTKFVFPLIVGNSWKGDLLNDSSLVISNDSVSVLAGHFKNSYLIQESWGALNDYGKISTWFVPGIGIVKKHHLGWSFGSANNYWELMEYRIK
jgi:hypothetical protein